MKQSPWEASEYPEFLDDAQLMLSTPAEAFSSHFKISTLFRKTSVSQVLTAGRASSPDHSACTRALKLRTPRLRLRLRECCADTMAQ